MPQIVIDKLKPAGDFKIADATDIDFTGFKWPDTSKGERLHLRYAAIGIPNDDQMTTTPKSDSAFIGILVDTNENGSDKASDYTWVKVRGERGSGVSVGAGAPSVEGVPGQIYIDQDTGNLYEWEMTDAGVMRWVQHGSLKGEQGERGIRGEQGARGYSIRLADHDVLSNTDVPMSSVFPRDGVVAGDLILDANGQAYTVVSVAPDGGSLHVSNAIAGFDMTGPVGPQGPQGVQGRQGERGRSVRAANYDVLSNTDVLASLIVPSDDIKVGDLIIDAGGDGYVVTKVNEGGASVHVSNAINNFSLKGPKGDKGDKFSFDRTFKSVDEMRATGSTVPQGSIVIIATNDVDDPDNAKMFVRTVDGWTYLTDLSGAQGIQGPSGTLTVGTVSSIPALADGTPAMPVVTNVGTDSAAVLNFGIPVGATGAPAGFGAITATYEEDGGLPSAAVEVDADSPATAKSFALHFKNLKGPEGKPGVDGSNGSDGAKIFVTSLAVNDDPTLRDIPLTTLTPQGVAVAPNDVIIDAKGGVYHVASVDKVVAHLTEREASLLGPQGLTGGSTRIADVAVVGGSDVAISALSPAQAVKVGDVIIDLNGKAFYVTSLDANGTTVRVSPEIDGFVMKGKDGIDGTKITVGTSAPDNSTAKRVNDLYIDVASGNLYAVVDNA